jgi:outer membrane protein OmpA-like peptidoglycan-associated protein
MKKVLLGIMLVSGVNLFAQVNKAPNPSFEEIEGKIKTQGQIDNVVEWYSPEGMEPADVFTTETKKTEVQVPLNIRGRAETKDGNAYVGIRVYSEREAKPRQFIQAKMAKKLIPGKKYCIKMHVMLSGLSKYAINNLGMHLGAKAIKAKDIEAWDITPQLTFTDNAIVDDQLDWVPICIEFEADGTERYITIGNFAPQSAVQAKKMRRPREFKVQQTRDSYYFIDDVSVIATGHLEEACDCRPVDDTPQLDVVYTKNVSENIEGTPLEKIEHTVVHYSKNSAEITDEDKAKLDNVATLMKEDAAIKITVIGYTSVTEDAEVAEGRAKAVFAYLTSEKGVDASRINYKGVAPELGEDAGPQVSDAHAEAEDRKVEFKGQ